MEKFLIVGLGNPGSAYEETRHNAGYHIVQSLAEKHRLKFRQVSDLSGDAAQGEILGQQMVLLLPTTYMNSSGEAVRRSMERFGVPLSGLMIVCDDVALELGRMRLRSKGSSGGHNGLKSIQAHLNTEHYARLRIGLGSPMGEKLEEYVLGKFSPQEEKAIGEISAKAVEVLEIWIAAGIAKAMQTANKKIEGEKPNG